MAVLFVLPFAPFLSARQEKCVGCFVLFCFVLVAFRLLYWMLWFSFLFDFILIAALSVLLVLFLQLSSLI